MHAVDTKRGKPCARISIGFDLASIWMRQWREFSKPVTQRSKAKLEQMQIAFDIQMKTVLT